MSVPVNQRSESKLEVIVLALNLCEYTLQICANENVFKPEYRRTLTDDIVNTAKAIYIDCWTANNIILNGDNLADRKRLQERACLNCNNLLALMQIAKRVFHLDSRRIKYWGGLTINVRNHIRNWTKSDLSRV